MRKIVLITAFLLMYINVYAAPYQCASGAVFADRGLCQSVCGTCTDLAPNQSGKQACDTSRYRGFVYYGGKTYAITTSAVAWESENTAKISNAELNSTLARILAHHGVGSAWIGAYDPSRSTNYNNINPNRFRWRDGSPVTWSNWYSGEPNNYFAPEHIGNIAVYGEHWAALYNDGRWNDLPYNTLIPSIVEFDAELACVAGKDDLTPDNNDFINNTCSGVDCQTCLIEVSGNIQAAECVTGRVYDNNTGNVGNNTALYCPLNSRRCDFVPVCPVGSTYNPKTAMCEIPERTQHCPSDMKMAYWHESNGVVEVTNINQATMCVKQIYYQWYNGQVNGATLTTSFDLPAVVTEGSNSWHDFHITINSTRVPEGGCANRPELVQQVKINNVDIEFIKYRDRVDVFDNQEYFRTQPYKVTGGTISLWMYHRLYNSGSSCTPRHHIMGWLTSELGFCPAGWTHNSNNKTCSLPAKIQTSCPLGNYPCIQNGSNFFCSSEPCAPPSVGFVPEEDNEYAGDDKDSGFEENGNCMGQIYLFSGQRHECRYVSAKTGFFNCCESNNAWKPQYICPTEQTYSTEDSFSMPSYYDNVERCAEICGKPCELIKRAPPDLENFFGLFKCNAAEKQLAFKRSMFPNGGSCRYVGKRCTERWRLGFTNICVQEKETYCCFDSPLAKIIIEAARVQLKMSWGTAKNPNCRGLTPEEFQKVNLDNVDFSAWIDNFVMPAVGSQMQNLMQGLGQ